MRPSCAFISRPMEGVGNAGCPLHPRPRVHFVLVARTRATTSTPESPSIPARNGFNSLCRALPGDRAVLPPSSADMSCLSPVGPTQLRELDASVGASGPHDFAVREKRLSSARRLSLKSLSTRPAIPSRAKRCRVHRNPPRVRDDHDTPLLWGGMRKVLEVIWGVRKQRYFCKEGWTPLSTNRPSGKSPHGGEEQIAVESRMEISPSFRGALLREPESICGRSPCRKMLFGVRSDRLHPYVRPVGAGVTAGQDGFRDASSKQPSDLSSANGFHGVSRTLDRSIPTISSLAAPASIGSASREGTTPTRPISVTRRSPMPSACAPRDSSRPLP